jgi:hypothetical protein
MSYLKAYTHLDGVAGVNSPLLLKNVGNERDRAIGYNNTHIYIYISLINHMHMYIDVYIYLDEVVDVDCPLFLKNVGRERGSAMGNEGRERGSGRLNIEFFEDFKSSGSLFIF